jgi:hypothetical protein
MNPQQQQEKANIDYQNFIKTEMVGTQSAEKPSLISLPQKVASFLFAPSDIRVHNIGENFLDWYKEPMGSDAEVEKRKAFTSSIENSNEIRPGERESSQTSFDKLLFPFHFDILGGVERAIKSLSKESNEANNKAKADSFKFLLDATNKSKNKFNLEKNLSLFGVTVAMATGADFLYLSAFAAAGLTLGVVGGVLLATGALIGATQFYYFKRRVALIKMGYATYNKITQNNQSN